MSAERSSDDDGDEVDGPTPPNEAQAGALDDVDASEPLEDEPTEPREESFRERWALPLLLIALTFASTFYVGAGMEGMQTGGLLGMVPRRLGDLAMGWKFSLPLMAILLAHEFGHYIAGRRHGVDMSPPYFIPVPFFLLGTLGAVIRMRGRIRSRDALLDVGAAGPIAGFAVALPVLIYGMWESPVQALPSEGVWYIEGRSVLYLGLLYALKGPIAQGRDIMLTSTAFAGWAGLLVTMINLIPVGQLDGGHVAYALLGKKQDTVSERVRKVLPVLGVAICLLYGVPALMEGLSGDPLYYRFGAGMHWLFWALLLFGMTRLAGKEHPPTDDATLSPRRRWVAMATLALFVLLFMPSWIRLEAAG